MHGLVLNTNKPMNEKLTREEQGEFEADAAAHGMEALAEEHLKYWLFKMLADEDAIAEADAIVEPHLFGDDWKLDEQ